MFTGRKNCFRDENKENAFLFIRDGLLFYLRGEQGNFHLKKFLHNKNCWKNIEQVLSTFQVLSLTYKKLLHKLLPTKKKICTTLGEKKF